MVLFVLSRAGYEEMHSLIEGQQASVWVNKGVLSQSELSALRSAKTDITNFTYEVDPNSKQAVEGALEMIARHHPGQRVWVEKYCEPEN